MPLLLEWGEEIDISCECVAETVFLILLLLLLLLLLLSNNVFVVVVMMLQNHQVMEPLLVVVGIVGAPLRVLIVGVPATSGGRWVRGDGGE